MILSLSVFDAHLLDLHLEEIRVEVGVDHDHGQVVEFYQRPLLDFCVLETGLQLHNVALAFLFLPHPLTLLGSAHEEL